MDIVLQNVADIKKLQAAGICTVRGVIMTTKKRLCEIKGLSEAKVDKIKEVAMKLCVRSLFLLIILLYALGGMTAAEPGLRDGARGVAQAAAGVPHLDGQPRARVVLISLLEPQSMYSV